MNLEKLRILLIPVSIVALLSGTIMAAETRRVPEWQSALHDYANAERLIVEEVKHATNPWKFTEEHETVIVTGNPFEYSADITYDGSRSYSIALPTPPEVVYCALLERGTRQEIVFVNYYSDKLWQHGWVIHRAKQTDEMLNSVGCKLTV